MKSKLNALVVILASIGVGTIAIAQARHDEKPHGVVNAELRTSSERNAEG